MNTQVKGHSTDTGAVIGPEADVVGLGGLFDHLTNEHGEMTRLMGLVFAAQNQEGRENLYPALRAQLLAHERTERTVLYATLRQFSETQGFAEAHDQQVDELESLIQRLDVLPQGDEWLQHLILVSVLVQRHVRREEDEFFPQARGSIGERLCHELLAAYRYTKLGVLNTIEAEFHRER